MLFHKKNCESCSNAYDEALDYCPYCHQRNQDDSELKQKFNILFLSYPHELILFALGLAGFMVFNILFSMIFAQIYKEDQIRGSMLINLCSYLVFFSFVIAIVYLYWRNILLNVKGYKKYIIGALGGGVVIGGSILITLLMNFITGNQSQGGNQQAIINITKTYPVFSFFIFGLVGPICEEFSYRVGLFSFLRRISPWLAYIGTALLFGLIHFDFTGNLVTELIALPGYIWGGMAFSIIYEMGGLGASVTSHVINNVVSLIMIVV